MSENITDISKWKEKYPFLFNVWFAYEGFENPVEGDASENAYFALCYSILKHLGEDIDRYKSGCMKLMRNLKYYAHFTHHFSPTKERCDILYNWLNKLLSNDEIKDNIISECFEEYDRGKRFMNDDIKCSYESNNQDFLNPMYIILLNIFNYNTQNIKNTLIGNNAQHRILCQNFVCEAVKIYKHMYESYCHDKKHDSEKLEKTCLKLSQFKKSYDFFHKSLGNFNYNIPSLDNIDNEISTKCSSEAKRTLLSFDGVEIPEYTSDKEMTTSVGKSGIHSQGGLSDSAEIRGYPTGKDLPTPFGNRDSPMRKTITTTVGTVAGASSLLALLYKFSPGGNWIRSGFRGGRGTINSNLYAEGPNELLFDGMEHNGFNSYSIGYEAM
ncbi:PIR protein [Plasmodium vivax]|nr:PIR protein [Plasmodium vivax]